MAGDKEKQLITKYLGDMHALESHILQALDKQASWLDDHQQVKPKVAEYRDILGRHLTALDARLQDLGGSPSHPLKEGVAAAFGVAAGVVDKLRTSEAAKDLRDDYTALSHSIVSYVMMHTTASAAGDTQTANLCRNHLQDNARFVMEINELIPQIVIEELQQDGMQAEQGAVEQTHKVLHDIWQQPAHS